MTAHLHGFGCPEIASHGHGKHRDVSVEGSARADVFETLARRWGDQEPGKHAAPGRVARHADTTVSGWFKARALDALVEKVAESPAARYVGRHREQDEAVAA